MEFSQFIGQCKTGLEAILLEEGVQRLFSLALYLAVVTSQNGLDLRLGLGCRDEVYPRRTHVL